VAVRVATYIDGFNLYNGLKEKHGRRYLWLDLQGLAASLLLPDQKLVAVSYFSARMRQEASSHRQAAYLDALKATSPLVRVVEGRFQEKHLECRACGRRRVPTGLVRGEGDRRQHRGRPGRGRGVRPVRHSHDHLGGQRPLPGRSGGAPDRACQRVIAAFPPRRVSGERRRTTHGAFTIPDSKIRRNRLPDDVMGEDGIVLSRPPYWS
jgi:hypothetical protein